MGLYMFPDGLLPFAHIAFGERFTLVGARKHIKTHEPKTQAEIFRKNGMTIE